MDERQYGGMLEYNLQWFAKDGPGGEKTEPATAKKLKEAREEGQVAKSKELSSAVELTALFLILKVFVGSIGNSFIGTFYEIYEKIPEVIDYSKGKLSEATIASFVNESMFVMLKLVAPFFLAGVAISVFASILQVGWHPTTKPMQPKGSKLNPLSGFKRIFSKDSLFELLKSIVKVGVILYIAYTVVEKQKNALFVIYDISLMQAVLLVGDIVLDAGLKIGIVYLLVGLADLVYQKHKFKEDMKMTKQEVKDEYKNTEGNPEIKGKQKARMREASQRRMMQNLPTADVVITNPTHLSVAIRYDAEQGKAPIVIAKGADYLAMQIREKAKEHNIEIVENKPLARMLYANVDIDQEIPPELYQAVAEVLAFVYNLKNKN